jgi:ATP-dependent exoDNAse (exonuclease V) alpha subunit
MSLAAVAAENLSQETGVVSDTVESWLWRWDKYQEAQAKFLSFDNIVTDGVLKQLDWYKDLTRLEIEQLTAQHVVLVDEAGMIGMRHWQQLLFYVQRAGAKLIAIGDDHQFKPIAAGDFFRELKSMAGSYTIVYTLANIRRQKQAWMQAASTQLAELDIHQALSTYEQKGLVHALAEESPLAVVAGRYVSKRLQEPEKTGILLVYSNDERKSLNQEIRTLLYAQNKLGEDLVSVKGKPFAIGDEIIFLKNDRQGVITLIDQLTNKEIDLLRKGFLCYKFINLSKV